MTTQHPQIIALGGGGLSMEENLALDQYILHQSSSRNPRVCFVPTASGDSDSYTAKFYAAFAQLDCQPSHLTFFRRTEADLRSYLLEKDVIYVGGGNTKSMLAVWRDWGVDEVLREAWQSGVILAGISAGAICWFEQGVTDSVKGPLISLDCLGFLAGSCCPHYDGESDRRPAYHALLSKRRILPGLALDDGVAAHFDGQTLKTAVSSRDNAKAYQLLSKTNPYKKIPFMLRRSSAHRV
jgi:peptidase E